MYSVWSRGIPIFCKKINIICKCCYMLCKCIVYTLVRSLTLVAKPFLVWVWACIFFGGVGGGEFRCYYLTILERLRDSGLYM